MNESNTQFEAQKERKFNEALELAYAINKATTRAEWKQLGKQLEQLGRCIKFEARNKRQFRSSCGVEE